MNPSEKQIEVSRAAKQTVATHLLAIDGEWTGNDLTLNGMTQFGAAWIDAPNEKVCSTFSTYVKLKRGVVWDENTLNEFWLDPKRPGNKILYDRTLEALKTAPTAKEAGELFMEWIEKCRKEYGDDCMLVSDTMGNDYARLSSVLPVGVSFQTIFGGYRPGLHTFAYFQGIAKRTVYDSLWGAERAALSAIGENAWSDWGWNETHDAEHDAANIGLKLAHVQNGVIRMRRDRKYRQIANVIGNVVFIAMLFYGVYSKWW